MNNYAALAQIDPEIFKQGFNRGWGKLPHGVVKEVEDELKEALGVDSRMQVYVYRVGRCKKGPSIEQAILVTRVFIGYGVTDMWGK